MSNVISAPLNYNSVYDGEANTDVVSFLNREDKAILDVGCGCGETGGLIKQLFPQAHVVGLSCSPQETERSKQLIDRCYCLDLERDSLPFAADEMFDVIYFSHSLEHFVDPVLVMKKLLPYLKIAGKVIIALPNVSNWRLRLKFLQGHFEYADNGPLDKTHLHFYTYFTAPKYLVDVFPQLKLDIHKVTGFVPLRFLRHFILSDRMSQTIDEIGCRIFPNLLGVQILMVAKKIEP